MVFLIILPALTSEITVCITLKVLCAVWSKMMKKSMPSLERLTYLCYERNFIWYLDMPGSKTNIFLQWKSLTLSYWGDALELIQEEVKKRGLILKPRNLIWKVKGRKEKWEILERCKCLNIYDLSYLTKMTSIYLFNCKFKSNAEGEQSQKNGSQKIHTWIYWQKTTC